MKSGPFSERRRAAVRDRAARLGPELLLLDRAFGEVMERLETINRPLDDALIVGCPSTDWLHEMQRRFRMVRVVEPGPTFAQRAGFTSQTESEAELDVGDFDAVIAVGTLDTVNELPMTLHRIRQCLRPCSPLLGAIAGGNSLPLLRGALIEGEREEGAIAQRVHPRIDAPTLAGLLANAGFEQSVVDVDRVTLRYATLATLIRDLRAMGASNQLASVAPITRRAAMRAASSFEAAGAGGKTAETIEILHFAGWTPEAGQTLR